ncbi:MAG TPA: PEGA domain-containing protein [Terriglobales bacterium]
MQETIEKTATNTTAPRTDRLELIKELARGSIGIVHKARNPQAGRQMALRQFDVPEWLDDVSELLKKILTEARAASVLDHPNIARLYTCGYRGFTVFLTSEFVEGQSLKELMAARSPELTEILPLAKQLSVALDYAHDKGVVHNFLNPSNIKVLPDGTLKLLDFGLLRDKNLLSQTPAKKLEDEPYLSPEQVRNKPVTRAANLFSAAAILYELYTARSPFAGKHLGEVDRAITDVNPHPLNMAHPRVPPAISAVILRALSKSPDERFRSGQEFVEALESAAKAEPPKPVVQAAPSKSAPPNLPDLTRTNSSPALVAPAPAKPDVPMVAVAPPVTRVQVGTVNQGKLIGIVVGSLLGVALLAFIFQRKPAQIAEPTPEATPAPVRQSAPVAVVPTQPAPVEEVAPVAEPAPIENPEPRTTHDRRSRTIRAARAVPPPPSSLAVANGQVSISATPPDATVVVEGQGQSLRTPVTMPLAPGTYKISISRSGYATDTRNVQVASGMRTIIDVRLAAVQGSLNVAGSPIGASVWIDGRDTGKLTPAGFMLDPAVHHVLVRKAGYLEAGSDIQLAAGQTVGYSPSLMVAGRTDNIKIMGGGVGKIFGGTGSSQGRARIEIKSEPKGAQVVINGTPLQKTTPVEIQLEPGNYDITIEKDGYQTEHESAIVGIDDHVKITKTLMR